MRLAELERAALRAGLRWHYYREQYAPLSKAPGYPQLEPARWADDATHDKIEALEGEWAAALAELAAARRAARRR